MTERIIPLSYFNELKIKLVDFYGSERWLVNYISTDVWNIFLTSDLSKRRKMYNAIYRCVEESHRIGQHIIVEPFICLSATYKSSA